MEVNIRLVSVPWPRRQVYITADPEATVKDVYEAIVNRAKTVVDTITVDGIKLIAHGFKIPCNDVKIQNSELMESMEPVLIMGLPDGAMAALDFSPDNMPLHVEPKGPSKEEVPSAAP